MAVKALHVERTARERDTKFTAGEESEGVIRGDLNGTPHK